MVSIESQQWKVAVKVKILQAQLMKVEWERVEKALILKVYIFLQMTFKSFSELLIKVVGAGKGKRF